MSSAVSKILVLGATGGTGMQVVTQALQQGHEVTAFVRNPQRLAANSERLRVIGGDVTHAGPALAEAVRGQDVVISTLGRGSSFKPEGLMATSVPAIVRAMESEGVRRLVFTSAYGVGVTRRDLPLMPRILIGMLLRDIYADKEAGESDLLRSALDWTIAYPATLTNGPRKGQYRVGERLALSGLPTLSRADLADFLLAQARDRSHVRKGVLVAY